MKVDLFTTPAVFDTLADEWDTLLDPERSDNFFMRHDWQRVWWKHLGRGTLSVMTVRDDNHTLIGIAPWFVSEEDGQRIFRVIGCVDVSDYIELILSPGHEDERDPYQVGEKGLVHLLHGNEHDGDQETTEDDHYRCGKIDV